MAGLCQDCTACCTVFEVKEVDKAFGQPCKHLGHNGITGHGCSIYLERPIACNHYICLWLDSQRRQGDQVMPEALRPDVCKVVMGWPWGLNRDVLYIYPLPGHENAWRSGAVSEHLKMILSRGGTIVVHLGNKRIVMKGDIAFFGTEAEFAEMQL